MLQQINKKIFVYLFFLIFLGTINNLTLSNFEVPKIKNIEITGLDQNEKKDIVKKLNFLKFENLFFLEKSILEQIILSNKYVEEIIINKNFPETLEVHILKTNILAITFKNGEKYLIGSNGNLIKYDGLDYNELPIVFGKFEVKEFLNFKEKIDSSKLKFSNVKKLYFFTSKRWDIKTIDDKLIKLPRVNVKNSLNQYSILKNNNIFQKTTIFDFRQKNQIITKDG